MPDLTPEERARVEAFGMFDDDPPVVKSVTVAEFMIRYDLDRADMGAALRDYRSIADWSPWVMQELDTLTTDFINWFQWERL